jgi:5-methylcytosine-specific restriction endonuclease McrA
MKIKPADKYFSLFIRKRDGWTCQRCGTTYEPPTTALHCSHYFGRTRKSVRYDEENCDALCYGCHRFWEKEDREGYRAFKIKQLGERRFNALQVRANSTMKLDETLIAMVYKKESS